MWSSRGKPTLLRGPLHLQETQWPFWEPPRTLLTIKGETPAGGLVPRGRPRMGVGVHAAAGGSPVTLPSPTCPHEMLFAALTCFL